MRSLWLLTNENSSQVVSGLWLLSVIGNFYSSVTLAYIGALCKHLIVQSTLKHRHLGTYCTKNHLSDCLQFVLSVEFDANFSVWMTGTIALVTVPALYHRHQEPVDRYAGMLHRNFSRHYKIVDENVISRLPRSFIRDKDDWCYQTDACHVSPITY
jgi:hypothetical protein